MEGGIRVLLARWQLSRHRTKIENKRITRAAADGRHKAGGYKREVRARNRPFVSRAGGMLYQNTQFQFLARRGGVRPVAQLIGSGKMLDRLLKPATKPQSHPPLEWPNTPIQRQPAQGWIVQGQDGRTLVLCRMDVTVDEQPLQFDGELDGNSKTARLPATHWLCYPVGGVLSRGTSNKQR